jgi:hypothetical protein
MMLELLEEGRNGIVSVINRGYREHAVSMDDMIANTRSWLLDLLTFASDNRYLMAILLVRGYGSDQAVDEHIARVHRAIYESLHKNIERAVALDMLPSAGGDLSTRAAFVHHLIEGTINWWLFGTEKDLGHRSSLSIGELTDQLVRFEFYGLGGD